MYWYTDVWAWSNKQQSLDSMYLRNPSNVIDLLSLAVGGGRSSVTVKISLGYSTKLKAKKRSLKPAQAKVLFLVLKH